jgi:hypothetical protein
LAGLTLYARRRSTMRQLFTPNVATPSDSHGMSRDLIADGPQPPAVGSRVQLHEHVYGHVVGAQGVVVRGAVKGKGKVLVRFDDTGYQISVPGDALRAVA